MVFAAAAGLFTLALRNNRARVRYGLWLAASIKFAIPLAVSIGLGNRIPWHRVPKSELSAMVVAVSEPFTMPLASAPSLVTAPVAAANPLPAILATVWAVGFLGIACPWWVRWRRIAEAVRAGSPVVNSELELPLSGEPIPPNTRNTVQTAGITDSEKPQPVHVGSLCPSPAVGGRTRRSPPHIAVSPPALPESLLR